MNHDILLAFGMIFAYIGAVYLWMLFLFFHKTVSFSSRWYIVNYYVKSRCKQGEVK